MSSFLQKVEAKTAKKNKQGIIEPTKAEKPNKFDKGLRAPFKPRKPNKAKKPTKFGKTKSGPALGKETNPKQTPIFKLRKVLPRLEEYLQVADPFDITNPSWGKFFARAAPEVMVALLWDMGHLMEPKDRAYMLRYFKQRIKN